jgi:AraC-like DNA-binding protein
VPVAGAPEAPFHSTGIFATPLVRVGCGPTWHASSLTSAITVFFPRRFEALHAAAQRFTIDPNVALVAIHSPLRLSRLPAHQSGSTCAWVSIDSAAFDRDVSTSGQRSDGHPHVARDVPVFVGLTSSATYLRQRSLIEYLRSSVRPDRMFVEEAVLLLVDDAAREAAAARWRLSPEESGHQVLVDAVRERLASPPGARESIAALAAVLQTSRFHLCRIFRGKTGVSIHHYRQHLRLRQALDFLFDQGHDMAAIARMHGFCTHSHFTAAFREAFGVPPSTVRESACQGAWARLITASPDTLET